MSIRGAYSLAEVLVVSALVVLALGAWLGVAFTSNKSDAVEERWQEFYRLRARLDDRVKRDIRSALSAKEEPAGTYLFEILRNNDAGDPAIEVVEYRTRDNRRVVERRTSEAVETYDFRPLLEGKEFVFEIRM